VHNHLLAIQNTVVIVLVVVVVVVMVMAVVLFLLQQAAQSVGATHFHPTQDHVMMRVRGGSIHMINYYAVHHHPHRSMCSKNNTISVPSQTLSSALVAAVLPAPPYFPPPAPPFPLLSVPLLFAPTSGRDTRVGIIILETQDFSPSRFLPALIDFLSLANFVSLSVVSLWLSPRPSLALSFSRKLLHPLTIFYVASSLLSSLARHLLRSIVFFYLYTLRHLLHSILFFYLHRLFIVIFYITWYSFTFISLAILYIA
jgi:hypothetical protein